MAGSFAVMTMLTKNTFLDEIRKQYVITARAKGLSERAVLYKHVLRNALIPMVTGFPGAFIGALTAAVFQQGPCLRTVATSQFSILLLSGRQM